ncbi:MAG: efflux RND transporter periplasmic adaptor subunit [Gammaproteobacteria bacterium]
MALLNKSFFPVLVAGAVLSACVDDVPVYEEEAPRVKYFVVGEQSLGQVRKLSGRLVAAETSRLSFNVGGTVREVLVTQGEAVVADQPIARLDSEPLRISVAQGRAKLAVARANLVEAKQVYERTVNLFEKRASSQAELDAAIANREAAQGNLNAAESELEQKERDLARTDLVAPFDGKVASRSIDPFQEVASGEEAFILESDDILEVDVRIPETLISYIDYGQGVTVQFPSVDDDGVPGIITEIGSRAEAGNAYQVSIQLAETELDLRPGLTAGVTFTFANHLSEKSIFLIPLSAIAIDYDVIKSAEDPTYKEKETMPVFIIDDEGQLEVRKVMVGGIRGNKLEVIDGLEGGEKLVSAGTAFLREGMTVELWAPEQGLTGG